MIKTNVSVRTNMDAAGAVADGTERILLDAGQSGINTMLEHVPHGATSGLAQSAFGPELMDDGSVTLGFGAPYAAPVRDGAVPHWIPLRAMDSLKRWARRILGDESAAWGVRGKIAKEGTEGQDYWTPGIDAIKAHIRARGLSGAIEEEL